MDVKSKNVLITGADGFIGSHLTEMLVKQGAKVKALSQYNSFNNWGWLEDVDCKKILKFCVEILGIHITSKKLLKIPK